MAQAQEATRWRPFREALSKGENPMFDEMMAITKLYASASSAAVRASTFDGFIMAIIFHHFKELLALADEISFIKERMSEEDEFR